MHYPQPQSISRRIIDHRCATVLLSALALFTPLQAYEEVLYSNNFSDEVVGEKPVGFDIVRPGGDNIGAELSFPIAYVNQDGPVGALIVGESTAPARSLPGAGNKSLRLYDYTSNGSDPRAYVGQNFVSGSSNNRYDVRLDLKFQRSTFIQQEIDGDRLVIALGEYASGMTLTSNAARAVQVTLDNEGRWVASGPGGASGTYDGDQVNELSIVANADPTNELGYDGPQGEHTLAAYSYSLYLNGARVVDGAGFQNQRQLGKFALLTGLVALDAEIDFLIDDIEVTGLRGPLPLPALQVSHDRESESLQLSWQSTTGVTYGLQQSVDLEEWEILEPTFMGDGEVIERVVELNGEDRKFFRLLVFESEQVRVLFSTDFESDAVGATTAAGTVGGVRTVAGAIVRDSSSVAPFGAENQYLQFGGPGVSNGNFGARAIVAGPPSSSYTETIVGISFKFYDVNPSSNSTLIGVGTWSFSTGPDLNGQRGVFVLNFNGGAVASGSNTSVASGSLPSYNTGHAYEITYFMNWTGATATVTGVDGSPVTLETQQIAFWMKDLTDDSVTDTVVLNSSVGALSSWTSPVFRNFSSPEADQNILYLDDLNITGRAILTMDKP